MTDADVERVAQRVAAILRPQLLDTDPLFTRAEAAAYCRVSLAEFDRERIRHPKLLKPARNRKPLHWRRSTLDVYRATANTSDGGSGK